jgi:hypothetical protein
MNRSEPFKVLLASDLSPEPSITIRRNNQGPSMTAQNRCRNPTSFAELVAFLFGHRTILVQYIFGFFVARSAGNHDKPGTHM